MGSSRKCSYTMSRSSCGRSRNRNGFLFWYCILRYFLKAKTHSRGSNNARRVIQPFSSTPAILYSASHGCQRDSSLVFFDADAMTMLMVKCGVPCN